MEFYQKKEIFLYNEGKVAEFISGVSVCKG